MSEFLRGELIQDAPMSDFNKVLAQGSGLKYVGGWRLTQADGQPLTQLYYEDRGSAILVCLRFAGVGEGLAVSMPVLVAGAPERITEIVAEMRVGQVEPNPRHAAFLFADLFTGNDPVGFAGSLRRVTRVVAGKLAATFDPDLGTFSYPAGTDAPPAHEYMEYLRARLRA